MRRILLIVSALALLPLASSAAQQVSDARTYDLQRTVSSHERGVAPTPSGASMVRIDNPAVRGGVVGALVGGAVAAIATFAVIESSDRDFGIDGIYYSIFVPIGMAVGAVAGAIIGASR